MSTPVRALLEAPLRLLYPPRCPGCDQVGLADGAALCAACAASLTELGAACPRCAQPMPGELSLPCARCRARPLGLVIHAPWRYGGALADAVRRLKFHRQAWVAGALAPLLAPYLDATVRHGEAALVVPVPLHWRRRSQRGFDQVALLVAAARPPVPIAYALRRRRGGPPHSDLGAAARIASARGAFVVGRRAARRVAGQRVVLVDDVCTTGATLDAAATALRAAGAACVIGLALARAEP
ncbi:MAG: phosphoribosyltransferase family protein [Kofleriaceae bacterium]